MKAFLREVGATQLDKHGTFVYVGYNRLFVTHCELQLVYAVNNPHCHNTQVPISLALVHATYVVVTDVRVPNQKCCVLD